MKLTFASAAILALTSAASAAELSPIGDWLVKEGYALIADANVGAWDKSPYFVLVLSTETTGPLLLLSFREFTLCFVDHSFPNLHFIAPARHHAHQR